MNQKYYLAKNQSCIDNNYNQLISHLLNMRDLPVIVCVFIVIHCSTGISVICDWSMLSSDWFSCDEGEMPILLEL